MTTPSSVASRFRFWFDLLMIAVYTSAGIATLLIDGFLGLPATNRYVIGATLIVYASYRSYKAFASGKGTQNETT